MITTNDILDIIKSILIKQFPNSSNEKIKIINRDSYYSFSCPFCGDSEKHDNKHRGTLYKNTLMFKCFNCDHVSNLLKMTSLFETSIDLTKKLELIDYVDNTFTKSFDSDTILTIGLDKLIKLDDLIYYFNNSDKSMITDFNPIIKNSRVYKYLTDRKIYDHSLIYEGKYWYTNNWYEDVLINMNMSSKENLVLGIQLRNLTSLKHKRLYKIYKFSELYKMVYDIEIDEIEEVCYNKLSYLYNILNVNWNDTITVFEGFLDTKFFPNSIGMVGKNTDTNILTNNDLDVRFFFDYDDAGIYKSIQYLKNNQKVFLWNQLFNHWASLLKNDTNKTYRKLTDGRIIDLNDLAKVVKNPYKRLELYKWFSKDYLDKIYI